MIVGIGSDLIDIRRVEKVIERHGERFIERIFTPVEIRKSERRKLKAASYAKRFAAKEACFKALGTGWTRGVSFLQVEVRGLEGGQPELQLSGAAAERAQALGVRRIHVSLTHEADVAAAVVVLEGGPVSPSG